MRVLLAIFAVVLVSTASFAVEPCDTRVTVDTEVALCSSGNTGVLGLDLLADGNCTVKLFLLGASHAVTDTAFVYLRDGISRSVWAGQYELPGWSAIDSMEIDVDTASETIYTTKQRAQ